MVRFLTPEWTEAYNEKLEHADLSSADPDAGGLAAEGSYVVAQEVLGGPDGDLRLELTVDGTRLSLALLPMEGSSSGSIDDATEDRDSRPAPQVTMSLSYRDAALMAKGDLTPATAINEGRVRVRGDLSLLVAGQGLLASAHGSLAGLAAETTY
jgi:hypothetical protein